MVMLLQDGTVPRRAQCGQSPEWLSRILLHWATINMHQVQNKTLSDAKHDCDSYLHNLYAPIIFMDHTYAVIKIFSIIVSCL